MFKHLLCNQFYSTMQDPVYVCVEKEYYVSIIDPFLYAIHIEKGQGYLILGEFCINCLHEVHTVLSGYFSSTGMVARLCLVFRKFNF